ncbi:MAG: ferrochelatase [Proteobacteria bacterium]|nr:ferrochelatase [Pseudomonadota bacterium]
MKYIGNASQPPASRIGIIVTNLGTPDAPEAGSLRRYLKQFLSDPRIVELPRLLWWIILHCVILVIRPKRSAANYKKIWTAQGSPLLVHTRDLANGLATELAGRFGKDLIVDFAMRYGSPAIEDVLQSQLSSGVDKLLVLPLYPQYSCTTTGSTFDAIAADFSRRRTLPELRFLNNYYSHPAFVLAIANKIRAHWQQHQAADTLIFSYHGEPKRYVDAGDPYRQQCEETTRLVAQALALDESQYMTAYQSRFGREEWLRPYLDETLQSFPGKGVKSVQIICPGFAVDCLETLDEIAMESREYFLQAGGERYEYISCLNSDEQHIEALATVISEQISGWVTPNRTP